MTISACLRYISGSMHYSRIPSQYWRDRLSLMHAAGLNAVQTYVPWNFHEERPGVFDFTGDKNVSDFLATAQEVGLLVIFRAGPFIDAEWDMGGLPSWLLKERGGMVLRSSDPNYLKYVDRWYSVLLPIIKPFLYENGGPVITVQVENEYGSYFACDKDYLMHLEGVFRSFLGMSVVLFTTDGAGDSYLKCGTLPSLYATVDFGVTTDPAAMFKAQRDYEPQGPLVNSEFYTGWLDHWGYPHSMVDVTKFANSLDAILALNASVNMYMFEGGTNFAFWNGANLGNQYQPVPTSYDYNAPLTEGAVPQEKYHVIRDVIAKYGPVPPMIPNVPLKASYGRVAMTEYAWLLDSPQLIAKNMTGSNPFRMEDMDQSFGLIVYRASDSEAYPANASLMIYGLHDRASVFVNGVFQGNAMRQDKDGNVSVILPTPTTTTPYNVSIVVENMGRVCYGTFINDSKGILDTVTLSGKPFDKWLSQSVPLNDTTKIPFKTITDYKDLKSSVAFFKGYFQTLTSSIPEDTYLDVTGWTKGQAFVNGRNVGRYWPNTRPQRRLYIPGVYLNPTPQRNELVLFEIDGSPCSDNQGSCYASLVEVPAINS